MRFALQKRWDQTWHWCSRCILASVLCLPCYTQAQEIAEMRWIVPSGSIADTLSIPVYEKTEIAVRLSEAISPKLRYDFDRFHLEAEIRNAAGELIRRCDGFYMAPNDASMDFPWRFRFFLPDTGLYSVRIAVFKQHRQVDQSPAAFYIKGTPARADNRGYLGFRNGSTYLSFPDGSSFFPLGECLHLWADAGGNAYCCVGYDSQQTRKWAEYAIRTFTAHGGNFARLQMSPFAQELEWHQPGVYDTFQNRASDLDHIFDLCRTYGMYINLSVFDHLITEDWEKPQRHFPEKPFNPYLDIRSISHQPGLDDQLYAFFTLPVARKYVQRKIRYCIARWGYSVHLAGIQVNSELEMVNHHTLFFWRNSDIVYQWALEMAAFVKRTDPRLLASVGSAHYPIGYEKLGPPVDFLTVHHYGFAPTLHRNFQYINNMQVWCRLPKGLPVMIEEFGWIDPKYHLERKYRSILHNAVWASAFSGSFGPAMPFFSGHEVHLDTDQDYQKPYYGAFQYEPLSAFFKGEDFAGTDWQPLANFPEWSAEKDPDYHHFAVADSINSDVYYVNLKDKYYYGDIFEDAGRHCHLRRSDIARIAFPEGIAALTTNRNRDIEVFALKSADRIIGWTHLKDFYWKNLPHNPSLPYPIGSIEDINDGKLLLRDIPNGRYRVEWWNTQPRKPARHAVKALEDIAFVDTVIAVNGELNLDIPPLCNIELPENESHCLPDYGFKIYRF